MPAWRHSLVLCPLNSGHFDSESMSCKNANSFFNARCLVTAWEANSDRGDTWWTAYSGGIGGFLGPLYISCCKSYITGFERSCISCRFVVFRLGANDHTP